MGKGVAHLVLAGVLLLPLTASGQEPMRCGNDLIDIGDTKAQVLEACGEPDYVDGNRWYYETGAPTPPRIVVFNPAGLVTAIETLR